MIVSLKSNLITYLQEPSDWKNLYYVLYPCDLNFSDEFQEFTQGIWRFNNICLIRKAPNTVWEYLQQRNGEDEIWLKDDIFSVQCIEWN